MRSKNKGQMLIEIVVAVGIIALVLVGVSDLMTRSLRVVTFQKQKDEAGGLVQKILNDYKVQRDINPDNFYNTVTGEVIDPCESGKPYKCTVTVDKTADGVLVSVLVEWSDGGNTFNMTLSELLARTTR